MNIAVSVQGRDLDAQVDPRFGRAGQFLLVDSDSMEFEVLDNPNIGAMGGAGIQTAQLLASKNIHVLLTGNCGPNAFRTLQAANIQVFIGAAGPVRQALEQYKQGQLQMASQPNVGGHFGDTRRGGRGQGMGGRRGRGPGQV